MAIGDGYANHMAVLLIEKSKYEVKWYITE